MKKYYYSSLTLFLLTVFFLPSIASAQVPNSQIALRFSCLESTHCRDNTQCTVASVHRALLTPSTSVKSVPNDLNTYLTECIDMDHDNNGIPETICTTGDSTLDKELFCGNANSTDPQCDHLQLLKERAGYSLDRSSEYGIYFIQNGQTIKQTTPTKIASDGLGNIIPPRIEWQSYTAINATRRYLIWNKINIQSNDPVGMGGQQQNDLEFPVQSATCTGLSWDPYGRLFDTKTLEPIPDSQVILQQLDPESNTLSEAFANRQNPNIINPFNTNKSGAFAFIVVDGTYKLLPSHSNYTQSSMTRAALEQAAPNMSRIYSNYYTTTSPDIVQKGSIQHRDIPMEPGNGTGYTYPLVIIEHIDELLPNGNIRYRGTVSHPFARLRVQTCSTQTGAEVCAKETIYTRQTGGPNNEGVFSIELKQRELTIGQYYKKSFTPIDLTSGTLTQRNPFSSFLSFLSSLLSLDVSAQENDRSVTTITQPIPTYIEGYAYDAQGNLLSDATVGIYVAFSEQPIYEIKTTSNGYFKITSEFIPRTAYSIRYTSATPPHIQTLLTTSQYLTQNQEFIESEKINPYLITTRRSDPRRNITPSYIPSQKTTPLPNVTEIAPEPNAQPEPTIVAEVVPTQNNSFLYLGITLLILSVVGATAIYYLAKKKRATS